MLYISQNVRVSACLSVCVFTFEVPFKRLFVPTSQSRMSKNFRDSEFSVKSNGKKWSHFQKLLLIKGVKSPRTKKKFFFFSKFRFYKDQEVLLSASVKRCFVSRTRDF